MIRIKSILITPMSSNVMPMVLVLRRLLGIVVHSHGIFCLALFAFQRSLAYEPQPRAIKEPRSTMILPVDDQKLVVTVRQKREQKPSFISVVIPGMYPLIFHLLSRHFQVIPFIFFTTEATVLVQAKHPKQHFMRMHCAFLTTFNQATAI